MMTRLTIQPGDESLLAAAGLTSFDAFMRVNGVYAASRHEDRETVFLELSSGGIIQRFFLKRVFCVPPRHAIGPWLRLVPGYSQPRREWDMLARLSAAQIPAMRPAAMGERRILGVPRQAFLLVEAAPLPHTLEDWLIPGFPKTSPLEITQREVLFQNVGRLLRKLDIAGFDWPDLHPKHIFAAPLYPRGGQGEWQFCLIDVERMTQRMTRAANSDRAPESLVRFVASMRPMPWQDSDLDALVQGWLAPESTSKAIDRWRDMLRGYASPSGPRLADDYQHPRAVRELSHNGVTQLAEEAAALALARLDSLDGAFSQTTLRNLNKAGLPPHRERIAVELSDPTRQSPRRVYLKRYHRPPLSQQFRRWLTYGHRDSDARREARFIRKLNALGIGTARVLARGEERRMSLERRSFLVLDELTGESLESLVLRCLRDPEQTPSWQDRKEIIHQLARLTRLMHARQFYHRDFYLCHLFLTRNADGGIVLRVIDLARMIHRPLRPARWRIKDLAGLDSSAPSPPVTRTDRLRFLLAYYGTDLRTPWARAELRRIAARSLHTRHRDARRASTRSTGSII